MKLLMMTHGDRQLDSREGGDINPRYSPYTKPTSTYMERQQIGSGIYKIYQDYPHPTSPLNLSNHSMHPSSQMMTSEAEDDMLNAAEEHLRPLIKKELRYTIQNKRKAKGLPMDVQVDFSVKESEPLTAEANVKRQRRRERNKVAAAKCRYKKKVLSEKLQAESEQLENQNIRLKKEVERLQEERHKLTYILNRHRPTCIVRSPMPAIPTLEKSPIITQENEGFNFDLCSENSTKYSDLRRTPSSDSDTSSMTSYGNYEDNIVTTQSSVIVPTSAFYS